MVPPDGRQAVADVPRMHLEGLTESPRSIEVEEAYVESYRRGLEFLVPESSRRRIALCPRMVGDPGGGTLRSPARPELA
jgi:hypothetical protein